MNNKFGFPFKFESEPLTINQKFLAQLPNGFTLKWCAPRRRLGFQEFKNELDDKKLNSWIDKAAQLLKEAKALNDLEMVRQAKRTFPKVNLLPELSEEKVLTADFDNIPSGFSSYDELYKDLAVKYPNAVVARTTSNKVKLFFVIRYQYSNRVDLTLNPNFESTFTSDSRLFPKIAPDVAVKLIDELLNNKTLFDSIDKKIQAFQITFISRDIKEKLKLLRQLPVFDFSAGNYVPPPQPAVDVPTRRKRRPVARLFVGQLDESLRLVVKQQRPPMQSSFEKFIRYLVACPGLNTKDGYDISTTIISKLARISKRTASRWRNLLEEKKLIECIEETVIWRNSKILPKKAKTYIAIGSLFTAIQEAWNERPIVSTARTLPTGGWHSGGSDNLMRLIGKNKHKTNDEIRAICMDWIDNLEGIKDKNDRRPMLQDIMNFIITNPKYLPRWRKGN